jgi:hypothetical protein
VQEAAEFFLGVSCAGSETIAPQRRTDHFVVGRDTQ